MRRKSEIRMSKSETNPNVVKLRKWNETRSVGLHVFPAIHAFGFCFGFRISDFGFLP